MVEGIILAAGSSTRAGCFKMELPLGDKTLIERSVEGMYQVCSRIIVVGGYNVERVREILGSYQKVEVVENVNWRSGMFSSVKVGVKHVETGRFFLLPADIPLVPHEVYHELVQKPEEIVIPSFRGRKGHPILLRHSVIEEILHEPDDSTLRRVIERRDFEIVPVQHEEVLIDVDSMADYKETHKRFLASEGSATA